MSAWSAATAPLRAWPALEPVPATPPDRSPAAGPFGILFVCRANVCRSVIAERVAQRGLRARLGDDAREFRVTSAGTASLDGCPVHPYTAEALTWLGADAAGIASQQLTTAHIDAADLILAAGQEHRDQVVAMRPSASRRAYLLREFARMSAFAPAAVEGLSAVDQARQLVADVATLRGRVPYVEPAQDEITDPVGTPAFLSCARVIDAVVSDSLDALCRGVPLDQYRGRHLR
jgi:protein-tyrosine phosphatase